MISRTLRSAALASTFALALPLAAPAFAQAGPAAAEREVLPTDVRPLAYAIEVTPDAANLAFAGKVTIDIEVRQPTKTITLNAAALDMKSAAIVGGPKATGIRLDEKTERAMIDFAGALPVGRHKLAIDYAGKINSQSSGLFHADYKRDGATRRVLATQFEVPDARRFVPSWDEPGIKAKWQVTAIVPKDQMAISNMPVAREEMVGDRKRLVFGETPLMSSYLLFFGMGDMDRIGQQVGTVDMGVIARAGDAEKGRVALGDASALLPYFNDYFGVAYPLPKMDHWAMPNAGGFGAMENWGAILYFERYLLLDDKLSTPADRQTVFGIVSHEMAHQWFGNIVTMSWWDDLWLNEGFASWMAAKSTQDIHPDWNVWLQEEGGKQAAMALDSTSATHPVVTPVRNTNEATQNFDQITYQKGQAVIRMIEDHIGAEKFRAGVRAYMKKHAYGNTVSSDLWGALREASGQDIDAIARDFTTQPGVPLVMVESATCRAGKTSIAFRQGRVALDEQSRAPLRWNIPMSVRVAGVEQAARFNSEGRERFTQTVDGCGAVKVNADQAGYYRTGYAPSAMKPLVDGFAALTPADQLGLLNDTRALAMSGDAKLADYMALAAKLPADADPILLAEKVGALADIDGYWAEDDTGAAHTAYRRWAIGQLKPLYARVGWTPAANEHPNVNDLRVALIGTLGFMGDAEVNGEINRRFAAAKADWSTLEPATRARVIRGALLRGDAATYDFVLNKAKTAASPIEGNELWGALATARAPELRKRTLALALSEEAPATIRRNFIRGVASHHPEEAWDFAMANKAAVSNLVDPLERASFFPSFLVSSRDPGAAGKLEAYIASDVPADQQADAKKALAALKARQAIAARLRPQAEAYVKAQR